MQWLNQQYWDTENGGLGTEENGTPLKFTFQAPIAGSEQDNFNTMMSTGEYTDVVDLSYSADTAATLVEEGSCWTSRNMWKNICPTMWPIWTKIRSRRRF